MVKMIGGVPHIPMNEAARELGTTPLRIMMLIREGVMRGCLVDDEWFVEKGTLGCFRSYESEPGKPGGCGGSCPSGGSPGGS